MAVTRDSVLSIIANEANLEIEKLKPDSTLVDLQISSIDVVSAIFALEDEFGIEIEPSDISPDFTLGQFVDHVMSRSQG
jgi:acyl carrier protein